jgi:hypothetical protein
MITFEDIKKRYLDTTAPVREPVEKHVRKPTIELLLGLLKNTPIGMGTVPEGERKEMLEDRYGAGIGTDTLAKSGFGTFIGMNPITIGGITTPVKEVPSDKYKLAEYFRNWYANKGVTPDEISLSASSLDDLVAQGLGDDVAKVADDIRPAELTKKARDIAKQSIDNMFEFGGSTADIRGNMYSKEWVVSPYKERELKLPKGSDKWPRAKLAKELENYIKRNADILNLHGNTIGTWIEDGKVFFDVGEVKPSNTGLMDALTKMRGADQEAIYNIERDLTIKNPQHSKRFEGVEAVIRKLQEPFEEAKLPEGESILRKMRNFLKRK